MDLLGVFTVEGHQLLTSLLIGSASLCDAILAAAEERVVAHRQSRAALPLGALGRRHPVRTAAVLTVFAGLHRVTTLAKQNQNQNRML